MVAQSLVAPFRMIYFHSLDFVLSSALSRVFVFSLQGFLDFNEINIFKKIYIYTLGQSAQLKKRGAKIIFTESDELVSKKTPVIALLAMSK